MRFLELLIVFFFDFLVNLICKYCKEKSESNILGKKGRNQKSTYHKLSRNSKCEQAWSDEYTLNPNITDGQVKLHVLSCRYIKIDLNIKIDIVKYAYKSKKRKVNDQEINDVPMPTPSLSPPPIPQEITSPPPINISTPSKSPPSISNELDSSKSLNITKPTALNSNNNMLLNYLLNLINNEIDKYDYSNYTELDKQSILKYKLSDSLSMLAHVANSHYDIECNSVSLVSTSNHHLVHSITTPTPPTLSNQSFDYLLCKMFPRKSKALDTSTWNNQSISFQAAADAKEMIESGNGIIDDIDVSIE